nr:Amelogenin, X like [Ipomoea batatas]
MAVSLSRFSWWLWGGKEKESLAAKGSSVNSLQDWGPGFREQPETVKFWSEYDVVLVPSDDVCLSGSESDDSDWSIGWLEPHAPDFQSDDEADNSFAVLVPCYRDDCKALVVEEPSNQFLSAIKSLSNEYSPVFDVRVLIVSAEGKKYMEQWLSSLQNF